MTTLLQRFRLRTKLAFLLAMATLAVAGSIGAGASLMYRRMVDDRIAKLNAVVDTSISLIKGLEEQVVAQRMTREEAIGRAREYVHQIRYGNGDYLSLQTLDGIILAHGANPALEGKTSVGRDANGRTVAQLTRAALANGDLSCGAVCLSPAGGDGATAQDSLCPPVRSVGRICPRRNLRG